MAVEEAVRPAEAGGEPPTAPRAELPRRLALTGLVAAVLAAVVLRLLAAGPLWLDESLSTEIARRPLGAMFTALRHDGSPPLYYLLLHVWIAAFGTSTIAVRALSSVFALLSLPLAWAAGQQLGGRRLAPWALLAVAMAPWTFRYATETRMYMLLFDLVLAGIVLVARALERPSPGALTLVGLDTLAIAYTHYWGLYLLAPVAAGLLLTRRWRVLVAMAVSGIGYLPWVPSLLFQLKHTGTPWAQPPSLSIFTDTVTGWGGPGQTGGLLAIGLLLLAAAGLALRPTAGPASRWWPARAGITAGRPGDPRRTGPAASVGAVAAAGTAAGTAAGAVSSELGTGPTARTAGATGAGNPDGTAAGAPAGATPGDPLGGRRLDPRWLAAVAAAPLAVALVLGVLTHAGYAIRYTAVALPAYLLLAALGLSRLPARAQALSAALLVVLGVVSGISTDSAARTQAGQVAAALEQQARPGDVVGFCPDQLSPAVHRLLPASLHLTQVAYADPTEGPALVDWVDYATRVGDTTPEQFAQHLLALAGPDHTVFLVSQDGYRVFTGTCPAVAGDLQAARGPAVQLVSSNPATFEHESLEVYPVRVGG